MHADTLHATEFWTRPRYEQSHAWLTNYQRSLKTRHRMAISAIVGEIGATSVLEIGSHCGPNLVRIAEDHPAVTQLVGVDVNEEAIEHGQQWLQAIGLGTRIALVNGSAPQAIQHLTDGSADVVLSCYALAYIAPPDRDAVLYEMARIAKKAVILAEPMTDGSSSTRFTTINGYVEWAHNYQAASRWIGTWRDMTFGTVAIDPPIDHLERVLVAVHGSERGNMP